MIDMHILHLGPGTSILNSVFLFAIDLSCLGGFRILLCFGLESTLSKPDFPGTRPAHKYFRDGILRLTKLIKLSKYHLPVSKVTAARGLEFALYMSEVVTVFVQALNIFGAYSWFGGSPLLVTPPAELPRSRLCTLNDRLKKPYSCILEVSSLVERRLLILHMVLMRP